MKKHTRRKEEEAQDEEERMKQTKVPFFSHGREFFERTNLLDYF